MSNNFSYHFFLYLFIITILLIISIITTFKRKASSQGAGKMLAIMNWTFFYAAFVGYLNNSGNIIYLPHLFRTAHIAMLLYMPFSYFYVLQCFSPRKFILRDLLHLLPVLLYITDYSHFFVLNATDKMYIYHHLTASQENTEFAEGIFIPAHFHVPFRYTVMILYWLAQVLLIKKSLAVDKNALKQDNPTKVKWLKLLTASEVLIFLPPLVPLLTGSFEIAKTLLQVCGLLAAAVQAYFLFSHPGILYGMKGVMVNNSDGQFFAPLNSILSEQKQPDSIENTVKQPPQYLSETALDKIQQELDKYMQTKMPYLKPAFSLTDMARETRFTIHQLSAFINKRYEMNFYSYINRSRIDYCKQKFISKEYVDKTLEAISHESGFQSRATFIRAFKNNTGLTPSEFIKELKKNEV